jgi:hypothetical protein
VAKPKAKIPRLTFGSPSKFALSEPQWLEVQRAFGCSLDVRLRHEITVVTKQFLQFAKAESSAGLMAEAIGRAQRFRKLAFSLFDTIDDPSIPPATGNYVDDLIALSGGRKHATALYDELRWFVKACDLALREMASTAGQTNWPDGWSWQIWVRQLSAIAVKHGPAS